MKYVQKKPIKIRYPNGFAKTFGRGASKAMYRLGVGIKTK